MKLYRATRWLIMGMTLRNYDAEGKFKPYKIEFTGGQISPTFEGAAYYCYDKKIADLLDAHPGNTKNGGADFYEEKDFGWDDEPKEDAPVLVADELPEEPVSFPNVDAKPEVAETGTEPTPSVEEPQPEPKAEQPLDGGFGVTVHPEVTTNQMAAQILKTLDPSIKARDITSKAKIQDVAKRLKVSFPNL